MGVQHNIASNPDEFWRYARLNTKSSAYPSEMHCNGNSAATPEAIVDFFADHFESIYDIDDRPWDFDDVYQSLPSFDEIDVTLQDVERAVFSLKTKSGLGSDEISPYVVKMCAESIAMPIWLLFQKSFETGIIPERLKLSRVVPVFKKGDKKNVKNYRMVAISSTILKIFERAISFKLTPIIDSRLSNAQHGFRPNRSITTNLMNLSIVVHESFANGRQTDVFYGDFRNAFDTVWQRRLIEKLALFNIGAKTAKWLCAFVVGRMNYVRIGSVSSRVYESPSGVPAGSILGPILFSIFINDLVDVVAHALMLLYADDFKILMEIRNASDTRRLQEDINRIIEWCAANRLYLNNSKCAMFTATRSRSIIGTNYTIGDHVIERKDEIRDLGIILDRKFTFAAHIETITASARQMIGFIKRVSNGEFTKDTQRILYLAYVRPKLEFGSVIWNPHQDVYIDDIESIQKQFVIYLLESRRGALSFRLAPYVDRCNILHFETLKLRRDACDAMLAYDVFVRNVNDIFINSKIRMTDIDRPLRRPRLVIEPHYQHNYLYCQPIARLMKMLNQYSQIVIDCDNRVKFRLNILKRLIIDRATAN